MNYTMLVDYLGARGVVLTHVHDDMLASIADASEVCALASFVLDV